MTYSLIFQLFARIKITGHDLYGPDLRGRDPQSPYVKSRGQSARPSSLGQRDFAYISAPQSISIEG
jgi:hypothetical protein